MKSKLINIINNVILESIADKYLQNKFGINPEFSNFEKQYNKQELMKNNVDNIIFTKDNWSIIKNPTSLANIGSSARGVIMPNGDLYLESYGGDYIHYDILRILTNKGILKTYPKKTWGRQLPQDAGFLTVQRYKDSPYISIGESNRLIYDKKDYDTYIKYYDEFLNAAKQKNPGIHFTNKLVGTKFFKVAAESVVMK